MNFEACPVAFVCAEADTRIKSTTTTVRQSNVTTKNEYIRTKHGVKNGKTVTNDAVVLNDWHECDEISGDRELFFY